MTPSRRTGPAGGPGPAARGSRGAATVLGVAMAGLLLLLGVALAELTVAIVPPALQDAAV